MAGGPRDPLPRDRQRAVHLPAAARRRHLLRHDRRLPRGRHGRRGRPDAPRRPVPRRLRPLLRRAVPGLHPSAGRGPHRGRDRIGDQARDPPRGGSVRLLRGVRRDGGDLLPGPGQPGMEEADGAVGRHGKRLRPMDGLLRHRRDRRLPAAAPVPRVRRAERRRVPHQDGDVDVPAVPAPHQPLHHPDRVRGAAPGPSRRRGRQVHPRHPDARGEPGDEPARLPRRIFRRHGDGRRLLGGAGKDGGEQPGDPRDPVGAEGVPRLRVPARRHARVDARRHPPRVPVRPPDVVQRGADGDRHHLLRGRRAVRPGGLRGTVLEGGDRRRRGPRHLRRVRRLVLHHDPPRGGEGGIPRPGGPRRTAPSASRSFGPRTSWARGSATRWGTPSSGASS